MISRALAAVHPLKSTFSIRSSPFSSSIPIPNRDKEILERLKHKDWLTPKEATNLLNSLINPSSSLPFFNLYSSRYDFDPNEPFYVSLITKLAQSNNLTPIHTLHQSLKLHRPQRRRFSDHFFFTLIRTYSHTFHRIDHALHTLLDMPSFHCSPSPRTFNFLLNLLVNSKLYDVVHRVYLAAPELGVDLDACSLNILIKGLCARGELNAAFKVFDEFPKLGIEPNARTFATLMKGLCEKGMVEEAFGLLERMEESGVCVDVVVFNVLIGGLRKKGRVEEGKKLLEGMVGRGCYPNAGSYNEVLCGFVEEKRFGEAKEVLEKMGLEGFVPSYVAYKGLVLGFCERGLVWDVDWALRGMVRQGFVPRMGMWKRVVKCVVSQEMSCVCVCVDDILKDEQRENVSNRCDGG
ncbi:pentatricopeptide repeat-containing protein At3g14580, mitochondrial [Abrus precatorius]|uniref:Pentatricopeptide repeat-containing protein At3g14580, mitochondrial n=1 Tax=Abrus precatorius TaxID=3816 RepID=A0A8B8KJB8_ABRPR|nr:pentatricopeptide repeat-containing protein At3g14580, mitochondrial [Abrus precatorius]